MPEVDSHAEAQQNEKFVCEICSFTRDTKNMLDRHMESHGEEEEEDGSHLCRLCPYQNVNMDQLKDHIARVHESKTSCNKCNETFQNVTELNIHMENHGEEEEENSNHLCRLCPYQTTNIDQLEDHIAEVTLWLKTHLLP